MKNSTDKKIIMLLQTDAEEGMSLLMEQYMGLLWSACRLHLDNPEDIRECIQETLTDFYEQRNHFDLDKGTLKAYLYVIAKRKAIRMSLRHDHKADELDDLKYKENEDWIEELAVQSLLEDALSKLDEQDSQIIRMRYYNGMTCKEIAHCMNLPVETVKKRNQRSLKKLRKILIAVCILGLLTACAVKIVYNYRFSKLTGFQQDDEDIWYTMVEEPMTIRTEQGDVVVRSVVWKEETVFAEFEFLNHQLKPLFHLPLHSLLLLQ